MDAAVVNGFGEPVRGEDQEEMGGSFLLENTVAVSVVTTCEGEFDTRLVAVLNRGDDGVKGVAHGKFSSKGL